MLPLFPIALALVSQSPLAASDAPAASVPPVAPDAPAPKATPPLPTSFGALTDLPTLERTIAGVIAPHPDIASLATVGMSTDGRPIQALHLSRRRSGAQRLPPPTVLIVAGLDGWHRSTSLVAAGIAESLLRDQGDAHPRLDAWIVPVANPDAWVLAATRPEALAGRVGRGVDDDHDGRLDEDPPKDVNGDGRIVMMRRLHPPPDEPATMMADPADPRLDCTPDGTKGELAIFSLFTEGLDEDRDGRIAEDAVGGISIDANFPHLWPEFAADSGAYPLQAPEAKALAEFVQAHPELTAVYVLGDLDSLAKTPNHERKDITGRTPVFIDGDDKELYERVGALYRETTGIDRAVDADQAGSFAAWCYAHRGVPTFASQLWKHPDASAAPDGAKDAPQPRDGAAAAWLAWSDRDQGARGFVPWTPFDHPTLGAVEIGGWAPAFRTEPPVGMLAELVAKHTAFVRGLAALSADVKTQRAVARVVAPGVDEVSIEVVNAGRMPMTTAMARTNNAVPPLRLRAMVPADRVLAGAIERRVDRLDAGARTSATWTIRRDAGQTLEFTISHPNGRWDRVFVDDHGARVVEGGWTW